MEPSFWLSEAKMIAEDIMEGRAPMALLKVAATSRTSTLAGAIAGVIRQDGYAEVQAIGAVIAQHPDTCAPWHRTYPDGVRKRTAVQVCSFSLSRSDPCTQ